jgi:hypothetical protein
MIAELELLQQNLDILQEQIASKERSLAMASEREMSA